MKLACLLLAAALPLPSHALLPRADRDVAEYVELATKYVSALRLPSGAGGVLIKERWILTTAQAAKALPASASVTVGGRAYAVAEAIAHADWRRPGGPHDVGLLLLQEPVRDVPPAPIYTGRNESGRTAVLVGFGDGGKRASINTVDAARPEGLEVRVKSGDDASDLQGTLTPGDLGAPMYFDAPEGLAVAGIAYAIDGNVERFARVSAYAAWIEAAMLEVAKREANALLESQN